MPYRKPVNESGMSFLEQQARREGTLPPSQRGWGERDIEREKVKVIANGLELRRKFDPRIGGS
jgi:hypothetical protein